MMATRGLMHYWRGNYRESYELLKKAECWSSEVTRESIFEAALGLSMHYLGYEEATPRLISSQHYLSKVSTHNKALADIERQTLNEINQILSGGAG